MFRVTRPHLNLLVKTRTFFRFPGKKYNLMHFERQNYLSKCIKLYFFPDFFFSKNMCAYPTLSFQTHYPKHTYFLFSLIMGANLTGKPNTTSNTNHYTHLINKTLHLYKSCMLRSSCTISKSDQSMHSLYFANVFKI